jgi:hypothetical protein
MTSGESGQRDLVGLVVDSLGAVVETDVIWEPYRLIDPGGGVVAPVAQFLNELQVLRRSARMRWIFCAGSGFFGRSRSRGGRRPDARPAISAGGWRWLTSRAAGRLRFCLPG